MGGRGSPDLRPAGMKLAALNLGPPHKAAGFLVWDMVVYLIERGLVFLIGPGAAGPGIVGRDT